jgi:hypothetical protein
MDEPLLAALASDANFVAMPAERAAAHARNVNEINRRVADAAPERLSIDRPPVTFDTLRAPYTAKGELGSR